VNERWVCKRCYAANDGSAGACVRCGLMRGSEATQADQATWAARGRGAAAAGTEPPGWRRWLRYAWIPVLAVVLIAGYITTARRGDDGTLTTAGTVSVDELRPGDCFSTGDEQTEIADVDGVPCTAAHAYEVFALASYEGDGTFPADSEDDAIFEQICQPSFEPYVGESYATSAIYGSMITPSADGWADGDREYICVLYEPGNEQLTESLRGAER
jgi:hypothetical protein